MKRQWIILFCGALAVLNAPAPIHAQEEDYRARQQNLINLSEIFGELHHIRRLCEPRRETDVWRERMKKLVALEEPAASQHVVMVDAFNKGYGAAQRRFEFCDRAAEDYAAARAEEGERAVNTLLAPLYDALTQGEEEAPPTVQRGNDR